MQPMPQALLRFPALSALLDFDQRLPKDGAMLKKRILTGLLIQLGCTLLAAQTADEPIRYQLRISEPHTHYVEVEASYPTQGQEQVEVMMAVWTPGSYLVREYSRNVEAVEAFSMQDEPLASEKVRKNRWRIANPGRDDRIKLRYRVYCHEMSVRTNWVEQDFGVLNGAPTFITLAESYQRPYEVKIELAPDWKQSWTGMAQHPQGDDHHYLAADFDTLVDSPILMGNPAVYSFEVDGKMHYLVNQGEGGIWDGPRSAEDAEKIVREMLRFWGELPYDKYVFLNLINERGGGLEHKNSTLMMTSRWNSRVKRSYQRWLGLVSHEYFHAWNVKRLRPVQLGPFDYENEVYTRSLWVAEGLTSYYGSLILRRAGLLDDRQYLASLSRQIEQLQTTPGRLVQPLQLSSFDSWIEQYRPDENSRNTAISYYTKGAVVGFLMDAQIRRATQGQKSLDDVMRLAFSRFSGARGFTPEQFRQVVAEVGGQGVAEWLARALESTDELDYQPALDWFGLHFRDAKERAERQRSEGPSEGPDEEEEKEPPTGWLGLVAGQGNGNLVVREVRRGTPAYQAGINVGDEILAVGDYRVDAQSWQERMRQYRPGDRIEILLARRELLLRAEAVLEEDPGNAWRLAVDRDGGDAPKSRRKAWLSGH